MSLESKIFPHFKSLPKIDFAKVEDIELAEGMEWEDYENELDEITELYVDPTNRNTIYEGTYYSLVKRVDGGESWRVISEDFHREDINGIVVNPNNPDIIYVRVGKFMFEDCWNLEPGDPNVKEESKKLKNSNNQEIEIKSDINSKKLESNFCHLHNNSQFSVLQSTSKISEIVKKSSDFGMRAVALTDKANMMGCFHFYRAVKNYNSDPKNADSHIKPIIGCELNVCEDHKDKSSRDDGYQVVFLVKNKIGYQNLIKMCSVGYTDGFYYVPRVDKEVVLEFSEGLIVLSGNKYGEIPNKILNVGEKQAIEALRWWQDKFGEDFYLELNRHSEEQNEIVNVQLLKFSKEFNIKVVATNSTLYLDKEDANAHDILLCVKSKKIHFQKSCIFYN